MNKIGGPKISKTKGYEKYELESAVRDLERAEEIKKDKKLMAAIQPMLKKKISSIAELKKLANEMKEDEYEDEE